MGNTENEKDMSFAECYFCKHEKNCKDAHRTKFCANLELTIQGWVRAINHAENVEMNLERGRLYRENLKKCNERRMK